MNKYFKWLTFFTGLLLSSAIALADENLGAGDLVRILVYGNPDLTLETRIDANGYISYPLVGQVEIGGHTAKDAESKITTALRQGGFIKQPNVNVFLLESRSKLTSIIGKVNKPGRYPVTHKTTLLDMIAEAGGVAAGGSSLVTVISGSDKKTFDLSKLVNENSNQQIPLLNGGETVYVPTSEVVVGGEVNQPGKYSISDNIRSIADFIVSAGGTNANAADTILYTTASGGAEVTKSIDIAALMSNNPQADQNAMIVKPGDKIYVPKAPMVYIYGEVQRPGSYRIEKNMTLMQALAQGGGPSVRGTQRGIKVYRTDDKGSVSKITPALTEMVRPNDVLYVEESLF